MLQGYLNDSGRGHTGAPFVLAGYILPAGQWAAFSEDWKAECAEKPSIDYFDFDEAINSAGQFDRWPYDRRRKKTLKLVEVIRKHQLHGLCATFGSEEWNWVSSRLAGPVKGQPYAPLLFTFIDTLLEYQKDLGIFPQETQLDFHEHADWGRCAIEWYGRMWEDPGQDGFQGEYRRILKGTPRMLDGKEYVAVQAAGMLAGAIRLRLGGLLSGLGIHVPNFEWISDELQTDVWCGLGLGRAICGAVEKQQTGSPAMLGVQ